MQALKACLDPQIFTNINIYMVAIPIAVILVVKHMKFFVKLGIMHLGEYTNCHNLRQPTAFSRQEYYVTNVYVQDKNTKSLMFMFKTRILRH